MESAKSIGEEQYWLEDCHKQAVAAFLIARSKAGRARLLELCHEQVGSKTAFAALGTLPVDTRLQTAMLKCVSNQELPLEARVLAAGLMCRQDKLSNRELAAMGQLTAATAAAAADNTAQIEDDRPGHVVPQMKEWHLLFSMIQLGEAVGNIPSEAIDKELNGIELPKGLLPPLRCRLVLTSPWGRNWIRSCLQQDTTVSYYTPLGVNYWRLRVEAMRAIAELPPVYGKGLVRDMVTVLRNRNSPETPRYVSELEDILFLRAVLKSEFHLTPADTKSAKFILGKLSLHRSSETPLGALREFGFSLWKFDRAAGWLEFARLPKSLQARLSANATAMASAMVLCAEAGVLFEIGADQANLLTKAKSRKHWSRRLTAVANLAHLPTETTFGIDHDGLPPAIRSHRMLRGVRHAQAPDRSPWSESYNIHRQAGVWQSFYGYRAAEIAVDGTVSPTPPVGWPLVP